MEDNTTKNKHNIDLNGLPIRALRQRLFNRRSQALFGSPYTFVDDAPEQIEKLAGFENVDWESFSELWDIYWVGLDPRSQKWIAGRKHSPERKTVLPLRIVMLDERTMRMQETHSDKADVANLKVPKKHYPETDTDRAISESLSGRVVIDEPDEDKAMRMIEKNMEMLQNQMLLIKGLKK